jgi:hypothetical protein
METRQLRGLELGARNGLKSIFPRAVALTTTPASNGGVRYLSQPEGVNRPDLCCRLGGRGGALVVLSASGLLHPKLPLRPLTLEPAHPLSALEL